MQELRIAFAGDRDIAVAVLKFILSQGVKPQALLLSEMNKASHASELRQLCTDLDDEHVLIGVQFREPEGASFLRSLNLDYLICIHFPYIVPSAVLTIPRIGVLNLHPAYLPYNRGWHTPSWAILKDTPIGGTLHFMDEGVDTGDIIFQRHLAISPNDTAHTLYERLKLLEYEVFCEAWPLLAQGNYQRKSQVHNRGSEHRRRDLLSANVQKIELHQQVEASDLLRRLRALTTNRIDEAAYYEIDGQRYRVQVIITEE